MATSEEIEKYCRNCVSRDFVNGKGLVCKRTRELPAFEEECESFEKDEELERLAPPKPEHFLLWWIITDQAEQSVRSFCS